MADLRRLGKRGSYRLGSSRDRIGPGWWLVIVLAGTLVIAGGAELGLWFVPFLAGLAVGLLLARRRLAAASHPARRAGHGPARLGRAAVLARGRPGPAGRGHRTRHRGSGRGAAARGVRRGVHVAGGCAPSRRRPVAGPRADATCPIPLTRARSGQVRPSPSLLAAWVRVSSSCHARAAPWARRSSAQPSARMRCLLRLWWRAGRCRGSAPAVGAHRSGLLSVVGRCWSRVAVSPSRRHAYACSPSDWRGRGGPSCGQPQPSALIAAPSAGLVGVVAGGGQPQPSARIACLLLLVGGVVVRVAVSPSRRRACCPPLVGPVSGGFGGVEVSPSRQRTRFSPSVISCNEGVTTAVNDQQGAPPLEATLGKNNRLRSVDKG